MAANERCVVSVVFEPELLREIDERATAEDLTRSQYLRRLAREDMQRQKKLLEPQIQPQPA